MAMPTIGTHSSTATGTRAYANRFGSQFWGHEGPASRFTGFPSGTSAEPSTLRLFVVDALPGFEILAKHLRQQEHFATLETKVHVEGDLTQRFADWWTALEPLVAAHTLAHAAPTSGLPWCTYSFPKRILDELVPDKGEELETVDWNVQIDQLPPRRSKQVVVRFARGSYRPPHIIDDPED